MTFNQAKEEHAKDLGYRGWDHFKMEMMYDPINIELVLDKVAEKWVKAKLEEAAERINEKYMQYDSMHSNEYDNGICTGLDYAEQIVESTPLD